MLIRWEEGQLISEQVQELEFELDLPRAARDTS